MQREPWEEALAQRMAGLTGTDARDWYLTYRARHGMLAVLEAVRATCGGGEVLTQLFTCCTAVDPILAAGLDPVYGDVSAQTCSLDPALPLLGGRTRAVMLQHTFGIVDDASSQELAEKAHAAGALVLEDCAHCVGRMARDAAGAPLADVSFHSFGVEKMLPTLFGGAVWVNPASEAADAMRAVRERLSSLPAPGAREERLNASYRGTNRVLVHLPAALSRPLRRALAAVGAFNPAVSDEERLGKVSRAPMRATRFACEAALAALEGHPASAESRRQVVGAYRGLLADVPGVEVPAAALRGEAQPLLRFPVLLVDARSADAAEAAILAAGCYTTAWYRPELGPGVLDAAAYRVPADRSSLRVNDRLVAGIVNLPTDIPADAAPRVVSALRASLADPIA
ncbi:MAG: DegT/DnrJ/EryC1/StrS family aminotransferase [Coriobacteriia bacterium]|nr:DegT/DnrJ/EryC1/StrS family aminotransferase [Coriobacteriia bacterium]